MVNEIVHRKDICPWLKNKICHIEKHEVCPDDCDLKTLRFDKDDIVTRMKEEEKNIQKLKKEGMFKNREKIKDKIAGVYVLQKTLNEHFKHLEPKVMDKDFERTDRVPMFPSKGWRKIPKKK